ncbi:cold-responsive protein kinase 1-like [Andrographis paniculata]|uniref:cold-responsive protein kinase 1-like n=1 Tax=Andrographis paniculata TaxID=175694 RepID=UPI0021E781FC|nr:cold-responsive protein kinase 1-like [Andrographis paniculata]XP_051136121.1 cold-responsive protein kinase 1-like [Andrographis paniculata]XP_051136122.1 cold-responsive protein kinase 1-like [Andrographis paniculata]XP_051136124.1 cold-responsive protein kinase 1-like [Andrographis paniculata]
MNCSCCVASTVLRKKSKKRDKQSIEEQEGASVVNTKSFLYNELRSATNNFSLTNKIGRGGFGTVYKGVLKSGTQVAVKKLSLESNQGVREFLTEINTISNVKHPNLVELLGCCIHGPHKMLVYEFVENNSIDRVLLGPRRSLELNWARRSAICVGTAKGLAFLHEELIPHIVHRDIKASNILLDKEFHPKIGDFGLAKLFPDDITHISTQLAGTTGYLAPEYVLGGQLTMKADVYSFGVLMLEVVSGRSSAHANYGGARMLLIEWAWELYKEEKLLDMVDEEVGEFPKEEVLRYIKTALFCTQANASRRPAMSQVVEMLTKNVRLNEKELTPPGFFEDSGRRSGGQTKVYKSSDTSTGQMSSAPISITQVTPR